MIPINSKPAIGWILDDLIAKGMCRVAIVMRSSDRPLERFLRRLYSSRMELQLLRITRSRTILDSLSLGLRSAPAGPISVILGDTLIRDRFDRDEDFVYTGRGDGSRRWCAIKTDDAGRILSYHEKDGATSNDDPVLAGYYRFKDSRLLAECVKKARRRPDARQISDALALYGKRNHVHAVSAKKWHDFGHIDRLVEARQELLQPRFFNSLKFDPLFHTITKVSRNQVKLRAELDWYRALPERLRVLTPRIVSQRTTNGKLQVEMEYYAYPTLAELFLYSNLHPNTWAMILRRVMRVHHAFGEHAGRISRSRLRMMYWDKLWTRVDALREQSAAWGPILDAPELSVNGEVLHNLGYLRNAIRSRVERLVKTAKIRVIHGDLCFSNILFDITSQIIKVIDPRGSFGRRGIYGDSRYDIAKLRHSASGLYEHIVADLFELKQTGNEFQAHVAADDLHGQIAKTLDELILAEGYDLADIRFIEGLLFVSMTPLHGDYPKRQRMMYLTGLKLLNEALKCE